ncbi:hypothetical protein ACNKHV_12035 [Shigella flexneri]
MVKLIHDSKIDNVILIDGGKGQLAQAKNVFAELDVSWDKNHPAATWRCQRAEVGWAGNAVL